MRIAAVCPVKGHQRRITMEDGTAVLIDTTVWEESPYGVGSSLSDAELEDLCAVSERRRMESKAVFLLSKRDLSRRELEQKLCREKGRYHPERHEQAVQTAARMEELGYVRNAEYAHRLAQRYAREKLYPRRRIEDELLRKGIDRETAREAASAVETDETEMALAFLAKKRYTVSRDTKEVQKIAAAMARYGYSAAVIRRVLREEDLSDE